jgi:catalase-peroxidase
MEMQGMGYKNSFGTGKGKDTITSGLEGAWTNEPTKWDNGYFENLFKYEWELIEGPGGKKQWQPKGSEKDVDMVRDAHDPTVTHKPMMLTTDIALMKDSLYAPISKHFYEHPDELKLACTKAWYKLTHRDMGPVARLLGKEVPEEQVWQDPIPACNHTMIDDKDIDSLKRKILGPSGSGPSIAALVRTAWASASTFRGTDFRGGANGARIRLAPQKDWKVNNPEELKTVLKHLESIQMEFNKAQRKDDKQVSLADLIVLGGCTAIEEASKNAGNAVQVPFTSGRMDASQEQTDVQSFSYLEPWADGFRNFLSDQDNRPRMREEELLVDKAHLLTLTTPEMTVLVGGLRALNAPLGGLGVFTDKPETLTNDFFVNLLDMDITWKEGNDGKFQGRNNSSDKLKWTGTRSDLVFGSQSELRAIAEYYAMDDAKDLFVKDFVEAWTKVMNLDRF